MTIFYILTGALLCSIIITTIQIRSTKKKEMDETIELFEKIKIED